MIHVMKRQVTDNGMHIIEMLSMIIKDFGSINAR